VKSPPSEQGDGWGSVSIGGGRSRCSLHRLPVPSFSSVVVYQAGFSLRGHLAQVRAVLCFSGRVMLGLLLTCGSRRAVVFSFTLCRGLAFCVFGGDGGLGEGGKGGREGMR